MHGFMEFCSCLVKSALLLATRALLLVASNKGIATSDKRWSIIESSQSIEFASMKEEVIEGSAKTRHAHV